MLSCEGDVGEICRSDLSLGFLSSAGGELIAVRLQVLGQSLIPWIGVNPVSNRHPRSLRCRHVRADHRHDVAGWYSVLLSKRRALSNICDIISSPIGQGYKDDTRKSVCEQGVRRRTHKVQVQGAFVGINLLPGIPTRRLHFQSAALGGLTAQFNLFIPANASSTHKVPVLIYLSGLTCTEDTGCANRPHSTPNPPRH